MGPPPNALDARKVSVAFNPCSQTRSSGFDAVSGHRSAAGGFVVCSGRVPTVREGLAAGPLTDVRGSDGAGVAVAAAIGSTTRPKPE